MDRMTYFEHGKNRLMFEGAEYSNAFVDRLASYEDTNLTPEEIESAFSEKTVIDGAEKLLGVKADRLHELADADRDGRCVLLPCKPGTPIYTTRWWDNVDEEYTDSKGIAFYRTNMKHKVTKEKFFPFGLDYTEFGKNVFLTRAEAEATLAKEDKQA